MSKTTAPGQFEFKGQLEERSPLVLRLSRLWNMNSFAHLLELDLPRITDADADQFTRAVKALRDQYRAKTRAENPFIVVMFPDPRDSLALRKGFERAGLSYLDYSRVSYETKIKGPA